jgi:hypothetical protein
MAKPDLQNYEAEVDMLAVQPPATIEIPLVQALAIITLVQAGMMSDRGIAEHGFTQIAVAGTRKLQSLFSEYPEIYKALELGWQQATSLSRPSVDDTVRMINELNDRF